MKSGRGVDEKRGTDEKRGAAEKKGADKGRWHNCRLRTLDVTGPCATKSTLIVKLYRG